MSKERPIKKEQLYDMDHFLHYCRVDEQNSRKLGNGIVGRFLDAAEKDNLLVPLYSEERLVKDEQGQEQKKIVKFYSPFQIFFASALSENGIDDEGFLRNPELDWEPTPGQRARYIRWGDQMSFSAEIYKSKIGQPITNPLEINHFDLAGYFHSFLKILHSLEDRRHDVQQRRENLRYYTALPSFQYDLESFKDDDLLAEYGLDVGKLRILLQNIGSYAIRIDPLEAWFYYAKRHPQWRRDELKGMASVAQDLYGLCDILVEIIEMKTGEKLPPLLDFLHPSFKPFDMKKNEYAHGTDLLVIKDVFSDLKSWMKDPSVEEILGKIKDLSPDNTAGFEHVQQKMTNLEAALADFESRYGKDRRYAGGRRLIYPETKLTLSDLDLHAQRYVEMIMRQRREHGLEMDSDEEERLRTDNPEILDLWKKGKKKEAEEKYFALQEQYEIPMAIDHVLDEMRRGIVDVCSWLRKSFYPLQHQIEHRKKMAEPEAIRVFMEGQDQKDPRFAGLYSQFWNTGMKEALKEYDVEMERVQTLQGRVGDFIAKSGLVYCAVCRKNHVTLHQQHNDGSVSGEAICDECLKKISDTALETTNEEWKKIRQGEWKCRCGKMLYKFAIGNTFLTTTKNEVPVKYKLEYGKLQVEVKCPDCGTIDERFVDWGWLP